MPRFVILRHETPPGYERPTHFDFMLECGGVLWTWSLPEEPSPGRMLPATRLADHRLAYLDFEGEVSGGRGWVTRWDRGTYEMVLAGPHPNPLPEGEGALAEDVRIALTGQKIVGEVSLTRRGESADQWLFLWKGN
jgi:hypothetical protein